jgi:hypothetical protein
LHTARSGPTRDRRVVVGEIHKPSVG